MSSTLRSDSKELLEEKWGFWNMWSWSMLNRPSFSSSLELTSLMYQSGILSSIVAVLVVLMWTKKWFWDLSLRLTNRTFKFAFNGYGKGHLYWYVLINKVPGILYWRRYAMLGVTSLAMWLIQRRYKRSFLSFRNLSWNTSTYLVISPIPKKTHLPIKTKDLNVHES